MKKAKLREREGKKENQWRRQWDQVRRCRSGERRCHSREQRRCRSESSGGAVLESSGGAVLESSGDDVHILLEHLRESGEELPQGAIQIRSPHSREGPFLHFQMG
ncbi:hypothetical protein AAG906_028094 [Vitis piasezkii]